MYLRDCKLLLSETKILQFPFPSQQAYTFQKHMKQFIWSYGRRKIIPHSRMKFRMIKFQFMIIRTNVITNTTKVTSMNKFRNISIPNSKSTLRFQFLPQQRTIWYNMTNITTKVTSRHKNRSNMLSNGRFRLRFRNFSTYIRIFTFV